MSGLMSRNKGKRGEREVVKALQPVVDKVYTKLGLEIPILERNLMQSHRGGYDIVGLEWLALEVKYQEQLNLSGWWEQCKKQTKEGQEPVLIYRKNNARWRVMMYGRLHAGTSHIRCPVNVELDPFLVYFEHRLMHELKPT